VHSAIGAHPDAFGHMSTNWNLSVSEWRDLIQKHGKVTSNLKVFMDTEVYAQGSNMLQAFFEIRQKYDLKFVAILDGDPPQPMHEDDSVSDIEANVQLCTISQHFLLNRIDIRRLLPDVRVVQFETPMRQRNPKVHSLSNAVRHAKAEKCHIQQLRDNPYDPNKHKVDILLCALRKDAAKINSDELQKILSKEHKYLQKSAFMNVRRMNPVVLKVGAPVVFTKTHTWNTADVKKSERKVVNGTRGHVENCDIDGITVCLLNSKVKVRVVAIESDDKGSQLPIQLGWATTIKKAAGMTFDNIAINFGLDWSKSEETLIQCAMRPWRTSQAYGAITRSRNLAYFCDAHLFTDSVMMALLNNQNHSALEFLKSLGESQDHYVRSLQNLRDLSTVDTIGNRPNAKKRRFQTCALLPVTTIDCCSEIIDHVYANQWPQTLARQEAGFYCTGVLTSNGTNVILKTSSHMHQQMNEIHALECLSGITGVPKLIGKAGAQLVISSSGAKPHCDLLTSDHTEDIQRIIDAIHAKGWTFKYITPQNVWTLGNAVVLFNFENAVLISKSQLQPLKIDEFIQAFEIGFGCCGEKRNSGSSHQDASVKSEQQFDKQLPETASEDTIATGFNHSIPSNDRSLSALSPSVPMLPSEIIRTKLTEIKKTFLTIPPLKKVLNASDSKTSSIQHKEFSVTLHHSPETFGAIINNYALVQIFVIYIVAGQISQKTSPMSEAIKIGSEKTNFPVLIQRELDINAFIGKRYAKCLGAWLCKSDVEKLVLISQLWTQTYNDLFPTMGPSCSWDSGMPYRDTRGYGTASSALCFLLANVHKKYIASYPLRSNIHQTFVDIGSGVCNIILQMSVLKHDFRMCFGIEIVPFRAKFAQSACPLFASKAASACVPFCRIIRAETGDAFANYQCKKALQDAGLVWINNELFQEEDNMKFFELLNSLVPLGCVIITFQELLKTKRHDSVALQSANPCDFTVREPESLIDACSWSARQKSIFIIQRTSRIYYKKQHFQ
jgi:hypothetical protein